MKETGFAFFDKAASCINSVVCFGCSPYLDIWDWEARIVGVIEIDYSVNSECLSRRLWALKEGGDCLIICDKGGK